MRTRNLVYPQIGSQCKHKQTCEHFCVGKIFASKFIQIGKDIRILNRVILYDKGIHLISYRQVISQFILDVTFKYFSFECLGILHKAIEDARIIREMRSIAI